ncbi:polysaccharide lyase beta-sandwich domain-containing protein [Terrimonas sp. NA20]|uniref:Polysaccharide lyase beta-sandwich domain-containing protein n=1 Tax=Terrimonas ginsenosidimutans TaxID=2908004 RepID=A0ABS9KT63_9BACT|nr:polysaccharide lyase family 8 super-sandwich domain-containing protein [Terrimonas ginsenosidimutans]MCG2615478.1 polysaccharide lyase beta-sandwich domain-containing protein [Terrimonas ginsenosidimutans]
MFRFQRSLLTAIVILVFQQAIASPVTDSIIDRYRQFLLQTDVDQEKTDQWLRLLNNGQWSDINYQNQERGNWKTRDHLLRLQALAIAWSKPGNKLSGKNEVLQSLLSATDDWLNKKYQNPNWWHNEIGVPQLMRDIMILLKNDLSSKQWEQALAVLRQHKVHGTGANLTWSADLGLHYAALTNNERGVDSCRNLLIKEIMISTREGVQPDFSFHQHGARLQNYHYGRSFLTDNTRLAWQCRNTQWAFPEEKISILAGLLLEGDQWMTRGKHVSPAVIDRAISRPNYLDTGNLTLTAVQLKDLLPALRNKLDNAILSYRGVYADMGYKSFPYSDYAAYSDKNYSFYLKTFSTRTLSSETTTNSENLFGHLLNGGNTYFIKNGNEYTNLMAVWDWSKLPGITNFNGNARLIQKPFNGGVDNGKSGCWATDHSLADSNSKLNAHKFWATHNNTVVCLIAGLNTTGTADSIFTVMDQSRLQEQIAFDQPGNFLKQGVQTLNGTKWIYHAGFAYAPLYKETVSIKSGPATGSWHVINQSAIDTPVNDKVFIPMLLHKKKEQTSGYVVAAANSSTAAAAIFKRPNWKIISNNTACQAVSFDKILLCAFFEKSKLTWKNRTVSVSRPCMLQIDEKNVYVSDPEHKGGEVEVLLGGKSYKIALPENGGISIVRL